MVWRFVDKVLLRSSVRSLVKGNKTTTTTTTRTRTAAMNMKAVDTIKGRGETRVTVTAGGARAAHTRSLSALAALQRQRRLGLRPGPGLGSGGKVLTNLSPRALYHSSSQERYHSHHTPTHSSGSAQNTSITNAQAQTTAQCVHAQGRSGSGSGSGGERTFSSSSASAGPAAAAAAAAPKLPPGLQDNQPPSESLNETTGQGNGNLELTVSSPALLLNHMAERYTSTPRVLMEFVDNAIDDAEAFFSRDYGEHSDGEAAPTDSFGGYSRPVEIDIFVDRGNKTIRVIDNCRGMEEEVIKRVVLNVGESKKRGVAFLNGQYGFGMQAFRTCCETLTVQTKTHEDSDAMEIQLGRWQTEGFTLEGVEKDATPIKGTGTMVTLANFDEQWMDDTFSAQEIAKEIELHFERLLARPGLFINVFEEDAGGIVSVHRCEPFDYNASSLGVIASIEKSVVWPENSEEASVVPQKVNIRLCVASQPVNGRISRFFVNGRRIKEVAGTRSFVQYSKRRWTVWAHPNVLGFLDISNEEGSSQGGALQPVITRDEFKRTRYRKKMFEYIIDICEQKLEKALSHANRAQSDNKLVVLENILTNCLAGVSREDNKRRGSEGLDLLGLEPPETGLAIGDGMGTIPGLERADVQAPKAEKKVVKKVATDKTSKRKPSVHQGFNVRLVRGFPEATVSQDGRRSALIGNIIYVDTEHEDFKGRLRQNRQGHDRFDDRICGYLATVIAAHYQDRRYLEHGYQPSDSNQAFQDMIDVYVRLEAKLRKNLPSLIRQMEEIERESIK